jgi:hypothetical protein
MAELDAELKRRLQYKRGSWTKTSVRPIGNELHSAGTIDRPGRTILTSAPATLAADGELPEVSWSAIPVPSLHVA